MSEEMSRWTKVGPIKNSSIISEVLTVSAQLKTRPLFLGFMTFSVLLKMSDVFEAHASLFCTKSISIT